MSEYDKGYKDGLSKALSLMKQEEAEIRESRSRAINKGEEAWVISTMTVAANSVGIASVRIENLLEDRIHE